MKERLCDYELSDRHNANAVREYHLPRKRELREVLDLNPNKIIAEFFKRHNKRKKAHQKLFYWADERGIFNYKLIKREVPIDEFNSIISCFYINGERISPTSLKKMIKSCKGDKLDTKIMIPRIYTFTLPQYFFLDWIFGERCSLTYMLKRWYLHEMELDIEFVHSYYGYFNEKDILSRLVNRTPLEEVV